MPAKKAIAYFINENGCHICTSHSRDKRGYPVIMREKRWQYLSRYVYGQTHGEIPCGLFVLHKCDTPECINPEHLFVGTQLDNMRDMIKKGRKNNSRNKPHGEYKYRTKFKNEDIVNIRNDTRPSRRIARDYGVSHSAILDIKNKRFWKHIPP